MKTGTWASPCFRPHWVTLVNDLNSLFTLTSWSQEDLVWMFHEKMPIHIKYQWPHGESSLKSLNLLTQKGYNLGKLRPPAFPEIAKPNPSKYFPPPRNSIRTILLDSNWAIQTHPHKVRTVFLKSHGMETKYCYGRFDRTWLTMLKSQDFLSEIGFESSLSGFMFLFVCCCCCF